MQACLTLQKVYKHMQKSKHWKITSFFTAPPACPLSTDHRNNCQPGTQTSCQQTTQTFCILSRYLCPCFPEPNFSHNGLTSLIAVSRFACFFQDCNPCECQGYAVQNSCHTRDAGRNMHLEKGDLEERVCLGAVLRWIRNIMSRKSLRTFRSLYFRNRYTQMLKKQNTENKVNSKTCQ